MLGYRLTTGALETRLNKGHLSRNRTRTYLQWSLQLMILSFGALPRGVPALDETMPAPGRFPAMNGRQLGDLLRQEIDAMDIALDALPAQVRHRAGGLPIPGSEHCGSISGAASTWCMDSTT